MSATPFVAPSNQKPRKIDLAHDNKRDELIANNSAAIKPGMLIDVNSSSKAIKHATEGGYSGGLFAMEETEFSPPPDFSTPNNVDTTFADGALVPCRQFRRQDRVNALCKAGYNYTVGTQLISDGAGRLKPIAGLSTSGTIKQVIGQIDEYGGGQDLTVTAAVDTRISVRVY